MQLIDMLKDILTRLLIFSKMKEELVKESHISSLLRYIECAPPSLSLSSIPDHESWIVTMWHFGYDSSNEYTNDDFEVA